LFAEAQDHAFDDFGAPGSGDDGVYSHCTSSSLFGPVPRRTGAGQGRIALDVGNLPPSARR
jgi:hypothetical protein